MNKKLNLDEFLIFDGAMGTMLQAKGMEAGTLPESYNITNPQMIEDIHLAYVKAGVHVITANTFGANPNKLKGMPFSLEEVISQGVTIAKRAAQDQLVALDLGPLGELMEPYGTLSFADAYHIFKQQVIIGADAGADLIIFETMSDLYEAKAAILAAKENTTLPVICTMTFQDNGRSLTGTDPLTMVNVLQNLGLAAIGINCSLGPKEMMPIVSEIMKYAKIPVIVQPNAGLPKMVKGKTIFEFSPEAFRDYGLEMAKAGVTILALKEGLLPLKPLKTKAKPFTASSSSTQTEVLGAGIKIIGERINPTGKKLLQQALIKGDIEYLLDEAADQQESGAHLLDINVGLGEIDEKALMVKAITEIQSIVKLPLQIDSRSPHVIEAGARIYNGRPIINSVTGDDDVMEAIFPIAKKYGCLVIGLTLDRTGIPKTAEERLEIARRIISKAKTYGLSKEDIIIDGLVLTASAQQKEVKETIKTIRLVKDHLQVITTLGISNVSFGLPARNMLNQTFLAAALAAGLDAPILDPGQEDMIRTVKAFNVLWNYDDSSRDYIQTYGHITPS